MTSTPAGNTQRQKWMEKYAVYQKSFIEARDKFHEAKTSLPAHPSDGMPKGNAKSDLTARLYERYDKARARYCHALAAMNTAYTKRIAAMQHLDKDQKKVLELRFFKQMSRRQTAKELGKSQTWVRCRERTGLFLLELPSGWELDILP